MEDFDFDDDNLPAPAASVAAPEPWQPQSAPELTDAAPAALFGGALVVPPEKQHQVQEAVANFTGQLQGVASQQAVDVVGAWLQRIITNGHPSANVTPRHGYRVDAELQRDPLVVDFLNHAHAAGVSESDVQRLLNWYQTNYLSGQPSAGTELSDEQIAAIDERDRQAMQQWVEEHWGDAARDNLRLINSYLDSLPAADRERLENLERPDGGLWLNSPEAMEQLLFEARMHDHDNPVAEEIERIETVMRENPKQYFADEKMQARLRDLYRRRDGA